ncbi:MAG: hypothetical protein H8J66_14745 [Nitrospira sp.]|nr:hypothetical protein [Nitrospira sp.]
MSESYAMPKGEFSRGWKLLILQPWGWRYRGIVEDPQTGQMVPSEESKAQMNFYYDKLKWAQGAAWMQVAEVYAQGKDWPSVQELKTALQHVNAKHVKALPRPTPELVPMPEEVRERLSRLVGKAL